MLLVFRFVANRVGGEKSRGNLKLLKLIHADTVSPGHNFSVRDFPPPLAQFSCCRADSKADGRGCGIAVDVEVGFPRHVNLLQGFNLQAEPANHKKGR